MTNRYSLVTGFGLLLLTTFAAPAAAQNLVNDGFQRHNGQMHVLRNGQLRPMTRDARLPTGAVVTKDGFIRAADGSRTELREGQGCDLKGRVVAVVPAAAGGLALGSSVGAGRRSAPAPTAVRVALEDLFGGRREDEDRDEDDKKQDEYYREQRKKQEEWAREERKRYEEHERERGKKWKEKWKKGKGWDD